MTTRGLHAFGDHFSLILYLLAPLYWLWDSPKVLLLVQALGLAAGAAPVYGLARARLRSPGLALLFALGYLLYPALHWMSLYGFHPDTLVAPLLLMALWAVESRRQALFYVTIVLALLCRETTGLTVLALAVYAAFRMGWRAGAATAALAAAGLAMSCVVLRA